MPASPRTPLPATARVRASAGAIALVLTGATTACGTKHEAKPSTVTAASTTSTTAPAPTTTQPPSTDPAVKPILNDLLHQWDRLMEISHRDPSAWLDRPEGEGEAILRDAFAPRSVFAQEFDALIQGLAAQGVHSIMGPSGKQQQTTVVNLTSRPSPDEVQFVWCSYNDSVTVRDRDGVVVDDSVGMSLGTGNARRVRGRWMLDGLSRLTHTTLPSGSESECPNPTDTAS